MATKESRPNHLDAKVENYSTVYNADGTVSEVANIDLNGSKMAMIDADADGIVDYMATDVNGDGQIADNEKIDVRGAGIAMSDFHPEEEAKASEVRLQSTTTVYHDDGTTSEIAVLDVDGKQVAMVDADNDGKADYLESDLNGDGVISDDERMDISDRDIAMADLKPGQDNSSVYGQASSQSYAQATPAPTPTPTPAPQPQTAHNSGSHNTQPSPAPQPPVGEDVEPEIISIYDDEGNEILVADVDRDGIADLAAMDMDGNGYITDDEVVDLTGENIDMASLREEDQLSIEPDVAELTIDNETMYFVDVDRDGVADYMAYDVNGDGRISEDEVGDLSDTFITMAEVRAEEAANNNVGYAQADPDVIEVGTDEGVVYLADVDRDGIADLAAMDTNNNGYIEDDEVVDVTDERIWMDDYRPGFMPTAEDDLISYNDDPDYNNDANVDDYLA